MPETSKSLGLSRWIIQLLAWVSLFTMFFVDKVLSLVQPPLPEHWYGVLVGVAIFDKNHISLVTALFNKSK